jgi:hypothetical protein
MTQQEAVILVHGLWMHGVIMALLQRRVARYGYQVAKFSYPSVRFTLTENAHHLAAFCRTLNVPGLHLVGTASVVIVLRMLDARGLAGGTRRAC